MMGKLHTGISYIFELMFKCFTGNDNNSLNNDKRLPFFRAPAATNSNTTRGYYTFKRIFGGFFSSSPPKNFCIESRNSDPITEYPILMHFYDENSCYFFPYASGPCMRVSAMMNDGVRNNSNSLYKKKSI